MSSYKVGPRRSLRLLVVCDQLNIVDFRRKITEALFLFLNDFHVQFFSHRSTREKSWDYDQDGIPALEWC